MDTSPTTETWEHEPVSRLTFDDLAASLGELIESRYSQAVTPAGISEEELFAAVEASMPQVELWVQGVLHRGAFPLPVEVVVHAPGWEGPPRFVVPVSLEGGRLAFAHEPAELVFDAVVHLTALAEIGVLAQGVLGVELDVAGEVRISPDPWAALLPSTLA